MEIKLIYCKNCLQSQEVEDRGQTKFCSFCGSKDVHIVQPTRKQFDLSGDKGCYTKFTTVIAAKRNLL